MRVRKDGKGIEEEEKAMTRWRRYDSDDDRNEDENCDNKRRNTKKFDKTNWNDETTC